MGKRQRRRRRQQNKANQTQPAVVHRHLVPSADRPLLEVHFEPDVSEQDKEICLAYWAFSKPGTWIHKVAEIGSSAQVLHTVKESCHVTLLTVVCPDCAAPTTASSRSDMTATKLWKPDVFPLAEMTSAHPCRACREAEREALNQQRQRIQEEQRKEAEEQVANASVWIDEHRNWSFPDEAPSVRDALGLLAMIEIMERADSESFGPLSKLDYTLSASESTDLDTLRTLYRQRWVAPTLPATVADFAFEDNNTVRGVYITHVPWRLAHALGGNAPQARQEVAEDMRRILLENPDDLEQMVQDLEAATAVRYLDNLLGLKYCEEPVPEHRLPDAYDTFLAALQDGFTLGQLLAIAWGATASSVAWGQRTPGLKPGSVSSAAVTNLGRRIGYVKDRPVPEYDLPNWVSRPATHATALRVLDHYGAEADALHRFRSLQQRICSRDLEALELDGDLADTDTDAERERSVDHCRHDPRMGAPADPGKVPITYGLVMPSGSLEFHMEPPSQMRGKVSLAGDGFIDRIIFDKPSTVNAYIGELVPHSHETANAVASEMVRLLDCHEGPIFGPVSFFAVGTHPSKPRSLDQEQQEMLRAAHDVATARTSTRTL